MKPNQHHRQHVFEWLLKDPFVQIVRSLSQENSPFSLMNLCEIKKCACGFPAFS
ncbi:MAG: hypothetical protein HEEMFOPI_01811 [Holosporales bacterium]